MSIVEFRNVLVHGYDVVDAEQVWAAVTDDLTRLIDSIEDLLGDISSDPESMNVLEDGKDRK